MPLSAMWRNARFLSLRRCMHPGLAYVIAQACHPPRPSALIVPPAVEPAQARRIVDDWRSDARSDPRHLVRMLYGPEQLDEIRRFIEHAEALR